MLFNERCYNESAYNSKRESVPYEIVTDTIQRIFVQRRASADVKIFIKTQRDIFADSWQVVSLIKRIAADFSVKAYLLRGSFFDSKQSVFIIGSVLADTEQLAIRMRSIDVDTTQIAHLQRSNLFDTTQKVKLPYNVEADTSQRVFILQINEYDILANCILIASVLADTEQPVYLPRAFQSDIQLAVRFLTEMAADTTQRVFFERLTRFNVFVISWMPIDIGADAKYEVRALIRLPENSFLFGSDVYNYKVYNQRSWGINKKFLADTEQPVYLPRAFQSDIQLAVRFLTEMAADTTQRVFFERLTRFNVFVISWMPIDIGADAKYEVRALIRLPENSFLFGSDVYNYKVYNQRSWGINKKFLADTEQKIYLLKRTDIDTIQVSYCKRQYFADTQQALKLPRLIAADFKLASYLKTQSRFDTEINAVFFTYKKDPYQGARDVSSLVYSRFIDDDIYTFLAPDKVSARLKRISVRAKNISPAVYIKRRDANK